MCWPHIAFGVEVTEEPVKDEGFWQKRAEEARSVAGSLTHPTAKREMLLVDERFEMLAKKARKQLARRKRNGR